MNQSSSVTATAVNPHLPPRSLQVQNPNHLAVTTTPQQSVAHSDASGIATSLLLLSSSCQIPAVASPEYPSAPPSTPMNETARSLATLPSPTALDMPYAPPAASAAMAINTTFPPRSPPVINGTSDLPFVAPVRVQQTPSPPVHCVNPSMTPPTTKTTTSPRQPTNLVNSATASTPAAPSFPSSHAMPTMTSLVASVTPGESMFKTEDGAVTLSEEDSSSTRSASPVVVPKDIRPAWSLLSSTEHFPRQCHVHTPTLEELESTSFIDYVRDVVLQASSVYEEEAEADADEVVIAADKPMEWTEGMAKVALPLGFCTQEGIAGDPTGRGPAWQAGQPLGDLRIEAPIQQNVQGLAGVYEYTFVDQDPMTMAEFRAKADAYRRQQLEPGSGKSRKKKSKTENEPKPEAMPKKEPTEGEEWSEEAMAKLEEKFWKRLGPTMSPPWYGADQEGSLFGDDPACGWSLASLDSCLHVLGGLPGVTSPYLYAGMFASVFAAHSSDQSRSCAQKVCPCLRGSWSFEVHSHFGSTHIIIERPSMEVCQGVSTLSTPSWTIVLEGCQRECDVYVPSGLGFARKFPPLMRTTMVSSDFPKNSRKTIESIPRQ